MYTVTQLARRCGLSRTTLLYYESIGLLQPAERTAGNYRCYGEPDLARLWQICAYRDAGLKLSDIRALMGRKGSDASKVLENRLLEIDQEIAALRAHQQSIFKLLEHKALRQRFRKDEMMTKEKWVSIMHSTGFTEEQMMAWHTEFERSAPAEHQEFLEFLHIPAEEIAAIRQRSGKAS
jgi:DNA-binding transcriptional MerR regulator